MQVAHRVQFSPARHQLICNITDPLAKSSRNRTLILTGLTDVDPPGQLASAEVTLNQSTLAHRQKTLIIRYPSAWHEVVEANLPSRRPAAWFATRDPLIPRLVHEIRFPTRSARFRVNALIALVHSICEVESRHMAQS